MPGLWGRGIYGPEQLSGMPSMVGAEAGAGDDNDLVVFFRKLLVERAKV